MYHDALADALPRAGRKFIGIVQQYLNMWSAKNLESTVLSILMEEAVSTEPYEGERTV